MKNLKKLRELKNYSQTELGLLIGFGQRAVSKWENDLTEPNFDVLKKLATIFNCSIDELLDYEPAAKIQKELREDQIECIELIKQLDEKEVLKILGYAENLKATENERKQNINK